MPSRSAGRLAGFRFERLRPGDLFPWPTVCADRDDRSGLTWGDGGVAAARVIGAVGGHGADLLPFDDLGGLPDGFVEHSKRVSPTCLVNFERNRYSVPASFANRPVSLRVYPDRLVIAAEGQILCEHDRLIQRSHNQPPQTIYDWRHYLADIQCKLRTAVQKFATEVAG